MNIGSFSLSVRHVSLYMAIYAFGLFVPVLNAHCLAQTITTYAGNGYLRGTDSGAYSGDGPCSTR